MTNLATRSQNPIVEVIYQKESALAELVGPKNIKSFMANVLAQLTKNKQLQRCSPSSFYQAAHQCARLNLQPGEFGHVYLVPYGKDANLQIGYKGLMELAQRHPRVATVTAELVYKGEQFKYDKATGVIEHPGAELGSIEFKDENILGAYCLVELRDWDRPISLVMTKAQIEERRNRSAAKNSNFWRNDYAAMARKTVIRALLNGGSVPMSTELASAIALDIEQDKRVEVVEVASEPLTQVDTGWEVETPEPAPDPVDNFGLGEPEAPPAKLPKKEVLKAIGEMGLTDAHITSMASDLMGDTVLDISSLPVTELRILHARLKTTI